MRDSIPELYTLEGWERIVEAEKRHVVAAASQKENRIVEAMLAVTHHPLDGTKLDEPGLASIVTIFGNDEADKLEFARIVRCFAIGGNAFGSIFSSEMWFSFVQADLNQPMPIPKVRPSQDPNRKEGIILSTEHTQFGSSSHLAIITPKGQSREIGPWDSRPAQMVGDLQGFLPSRKPTLGEQIIARNYLYMHKLDKSLTLFKPEEFN
jgi:hypothetical protein